MTSLTKECYSKAIGILEGNLTERGFETAGGVYYSSQLWARDACTGILGAELSGEKELIKGSETTLNTLKKGQTKLGMIPNFSILGHFDYGESGSIDASLWYIIASEFHYRNTQDKKFLKKFWPSIKKAYQWLQYQDQSNLGLLDSQRGGEIVDASIQRCGKVLYVNALWYQTLKCMKTLSREMKERVVSDGEIQNVKKLINYMFWPEKKGLEEIPVVKGNPLEWAKAYEGEIKPEREYYAMNIDVEWWENYFDTLANSLVILFGIANKEKTKRIINYAERRRIAEPFPARCLDPVIEMEDTHLWNPEIDRVRPRHLKFTPYQFWNSGVWPFIGAFYILALEKAGEKGKANKYLEELAGANKRGKNFEWEFNEWLHGKTGEPRGQAHQSRSVGMYITAYNVVDRKVKGLFL